MHDLMPAVTDTDFWISLRQESVQLCAQAVATGPRSDSIVSRSSEEHSSPTTMPSRKARQATANTRIGKGP